LVTALIGGAPTSEGALDIRSLIASLIGALVLLAISNLFSSRNNPPRSERDIMNKKGKLHADRAARKRR